MTTLRQFSFFVAIFACFAAVLASAIPPPPAASRPAAVAPGNEEESTDNPPTTTITTTTSTTTRNAVSIMGRDSSSRAAGGDESDKFRDKEVESVKMQGISAPSDGGGGGGEERGEGEKQRVSHGIVVETSQIRLGTGKRLRRQSNRLARSRKARSPGDGGVDTSNEDVSNFEHRDLISCISYPANDTIPAAHVRGHGTKPFATPPPEKAEEGYQQRWQCCEYGLTPSHNAHAFVDGGMIFNQTDKTLRVPKCGYYHVTSQIYFKIDPSTLTDNSRSVYHLLRFERNCSDWPDTNPVTVLGKSAVSRDDTITHTSDVVRLCAGGKVWVEIPALPNRVPCCPKGDDQGTFISAFLVAETTCHWPPDITMRNLS